MPTPTRDPAKRAEIEEHLGVKIDSLEGQIKLMGLLVMRAMCDSRIKEETRVDILNRYMSLVSSDSLLRALTIITEEAASTPIETVIALSALAAADTSKKSFAQLKNLLSLFYEKAPESTTPEVIRL